MLHRRDFVYFKGHMVVHGQPGQLSARICPYDQNAIVTQKIDWVDVGLPRDADGQPAIAATLQDLPGLIVGQDRPGTLIGFHNADLHTVARCFRHIPSTTGAPSVPLAPIRRQARKQPLHQLVGGRRQQQALATAHSKAEICDLMAAVDTDKTVKDTDSFEEGVIAALLVELRDSVSMGTPIARITATPGRSRPAPPPAATPRESTEPEALHVPLVPPRRPNPRSIPPPPAEHRAHAAPPMQHPASRLGVDTDLLQGSGKNGAVTRADVERAAAAPRLARGG
jgi:hypothetical protein